MKLVRITHYRCGDYDCSSLILASDEWSGDEIQDRIDKAMDRYLDAVNAAAKAQRSFRIRTYQMSPRRTLIRT